MQNQESVQRSVSSAKKHANGSGRLHAEYKCATCGWVGANPYYHKDKHPKHVTEKTGRKVASGTGSNVKHASEFKRAYRCLTCDKVVGDGNYHKRKYGHPVVKLNRHDQPNRSRQQSSASNGEIQHGGNQCQQG